jgi:NADH-quinone oxidoreductase subunit M
MVLDKFSELVSDTWLLSLIVFVPTLAALVILLVPSRSKDTIKWISLVATFVTFGLTLILLGEYMQFSGAGNELGERAQVAKRAMLANQPNDPKDLVFRYDWIGSAAAKGFHVEYYMGVDGISLPLVLLTGFISLLGMIASWNIDKQTKGYCILYLLLETGMMGTFLALDFFLFYVFWEVTLLPMYFLIGIWGAPSRVEPDGRVRGGPYAAIKFFLYTLAGSVLLLVAMLGFYFYPVQLEAQGQALNAPVIPGDAASAGSPSALSAPQPRYMFDLMQLQAWATGSRRIYGTTFQLVMFLLMYIGFAIKVPVFPFHTWLPDAHVEAPTPISMILAGVLLKMGGYGLIRIAFPLCPNAALYLAWPLVAFGVWNIIYGAFAAMAQTDFKKLVAYSSVSHMGYVILGLAVWGTAADFNPHIWSAGMNGAMFQMIAHGISSAGMFFMVGVIYDRLHHRDLNRFGGLASLMPLYGGLSAGIFFAGLGLPGMCGFIGEVMTVLAAWQFSHWIAVVAATGVILTAGYILWTLQRVFLGVNKSMAAQGHDATHGAGEHGAEHGHELPDITSRELLCAVPLLAMAILLGIYPNLLFSFMENSVTSLVLRLHGTATEVASVVGHLVR